MRKVCVIAMFISAQLQCADHNYWEQVFQTSIDRQAQAEIANFQDFPVDVEPSSFFGMRTHPITQEYRSHNGIDLPGAEGSPFKAVAHGEVIFSGERGSLGLLIEIDHGNGVVTRYGHANSLMFAVGDKVRRGDVIGTIGSTGNVTGPHVHYEVLNHGENIDPEYFVAERRGLSVDEYRKQLLDGPAINIDSYVDSLLLQHKASSNENLALINHEQRAKEVDSVFKTVTTQSEKSVEAALAQVNQATQTVVEQISEMVNIQILANSALESQNSIDSLDDLHLQLLNKKLNRTVKVDEELSAYTQESDTEADSVVSEVTSTPEEDKSSSFVTKRTLWAIADEIKPDNTTVYQSMLAIFQTNPDAFPTANMNSRYLDVAITLPESDYIASIDPKVAHDKYYDDLAALSAFPMRVSMVDHLKKDIAP